VSTYEQLYAEIRNSPELLQERIAEVVRVDHEDVLSSMLAQAQSFMEWSYLQVKAEMEAKKARFYLEEEIEPQCRAEAEVSLKAEGERATVERKRDYVVKHDDYKTARQHYLVTQERALVLKRVVDALFQKKDMLQSLNSRQKVEFDALQHDMEPEAWESIPTNGDHEQIDKIFHQAEHYGNPPVPSQQELVSSIQRGRAAFRMKRKERLTRNKMENSDE